MKPLNENETVRQLATYRLRELGQSGALSDEIRGLATLDAQCPTCKGLVKEGAEEYTCIGAEDDQASLGCGFGFKKTHAGRSFTVGEAELLVREGKIGPLTGFISKAGAPFTAKMCFLFNNSSQNYRLQFDFDKDSKPVRSGTLTDFSNETSVGLCPKCSSSVYEQEKDYVCINSVVLATNPKPHCDFKTSRIVLQQAVSREQVGKLLSSGRTDPLEGFVSSRTKKRFTAMLVWDPVVGKVNFEFET
jgi:DNA topoisomerase-3